MSGNSEAQCYLVIEADTFETLGGARVRGLRIAEMRKNKPSLKPNQIAVKVRVTVPDSVFLQPPFVAEINVPEQDVIRPTVEIEGSNGVE